MPGRGLEPLRISPPDPKSGATANFATLAITPQIADSRFQIEFQQALRDLDVAKWTARQQPGARRWGPLATAVVLASFSPRPRRVLHQPLRPRSGKCCDS